MRAGETPETGETGRGLTSAQPAAHEAGEQEVAQRAKRFVSDIIRAATPSPPPERASVTISPEEREEIAQHAKRFLASVVQAVAPPVTPPPKSADAAVASALSLKSTFAASTTAPKSLSEVDGSSTTPLASTPGTRSRPVDILRKQETLGAFDLYDKSRERVTLRVSLAGGARLAEVTLPMTHTLREAGQCIMRHAALPIIPHLFLGKRQLPCGHASDPSERLMDSGVPGGEVVDVTAQLCTAIVTASKDGTAKIWNAETGVCELSLEGHGNTVYAATFSPSLRAVVTASEDRTARIWRTEDGKCMRTLVGHRDAVYSATYSPDGKWVVTASEDGTGKIWLVKTGDCKWTLRGHNCSVLWATYSPDGRRVTTTSQDGTLRIWNAKTGVCERTLSGQDPVYLVSFTSDGKSFVTQNTGDSTAQICDLVTGQCARELRGHKDLVMSACFAPALQGDPG